MDDARFTHLAYYERLVLQIKQQVVTGILNPGDKLPSVREMAKPVQLNPNTVAKAYKQLEQDQVITVRPGMGSFIADTAPKADQSQVKALHGRFDALVLEAKAAGIGFDQLQGWLAAQFKKKEGQG